MIQYENKEWTNTWFDEMNDMDSVRVMLIGDSITAQYVGPVNAHLGKGVRANSIASSKALDNPYYNAEIDVFACQRGFDYQLIHYNNGLHGFHLSKEEYGRLYEEKVLWLMERFQRAKLVLVTSTPIVAEQGERKPDEKRNAVVLERNEEVKRIAAKYGLAVDDLYAVSIDHPEWRAERDGYHFNAEGRDAHGRAVAACIRSNLGL